MTLPPSRGGAGFNPIEVAVNTTNRRKFGIAERQAMYLAANGKCANCGTPLSAGWHADHKVAWAKGGVTDVLNGQALCPGCNLRKGSRTMLKLWDRPMREWQDAALEQYRAAGLADFLCVACPGAGKTTLALRLAHDALSRGTAVRVVVVCPTEHLKTQWTKEAHKVGIELDPNSGTGAEAKDFHGIAVTYQGVFMGAILQRMLCGRPTFVIFDEIHHAGDGNGWGDELRRAFTPAVARLCLSGTPFREDNQTIPFVRYDGEMKSIPDYSYSYGRAQGDGVCRPVYFPTYEGDVEWMKDGQTLSHRFSDDLGENKARQRLRAALSPDVEYLPELLRQAHCHLKAIREAGNHPDAGGLALAYDQAHALKIAGILRELSGEDVTVILSDEEKTTGSIDGFKNGRQMWIVAVRMVSEGVDIPRLRVLAYVTNVTTEMFFRQALGRIVRTIGGVEEQSAYFYCPADPLFVQYARDIQEERNHQLEEEAEREIREAYEEGREIGVFVPLSGNAEAHDVIHKGESYKQDEIGDARRLVEEFGLPANTPPASIAALVRSLKGPPGGAVTATATALRHVPPADTAPLNVRKTKLRSLLSRMVGAVVNRWGMDRRTGYREVNARLYRMDGSLQKDATEAQLLRRIEVIQRWTKEGVGHA